MDIPSIRAPKQCGADLQILSLSKDGPSHSGGPSSRHSSRASKYLGTNVAFSMGGPFPWVCGRGTPFFLHW